MIKMKVLFGATEREITEIIARFVSCLGLSEAAGKIWGALMLAGKPLSQDDIAKLTNYSIGVVSSNLSFLERLGFVVKVGRKGRRSLYASSSTLMDIFEKFFQQVLDVQVTSLLRFLQERMDSLSEATRENAMKILNEYKKIRVAINMIIPLLRKIRHFSPNSI